jgi:hypothetical protein
MTLPGSGVGGNAGGSQVPMQREIEATAWTEVNKAALGIVQDSLDLPLTQINPRYASVYNDGYKTSEGHPFLKLPLETMRMALGSQSATDDTWKTIYENLIRQLPPQLQKRLAYEGSKPFDERNGMYAAFDAVLMAAAKVLARMDHLAKNFSLADGVVAARTQRNLEVSVLALQNLISQGSDICAQALAFVLAQGPNHPHFDASINFLKRMQKGIDDLRQLFLELKEASHTPQTAEKMAQIAKHFEAMNKTLQRIPLDNDLQILTSTMKTMIALSTALALPNLGAAALFLGMTTASIGIQTSESKSGMIGGALAAISRNLTQSLAETLFPQADDNSKRFLEMLIPLGGVILIGLASETVERGFGMKPNPHSSEAEANDAFAFELALTLADRTEIVKVIIQEVVGNCGGTTNGKGKQAVEILAAGAAWLMILAGTSRKSSNRDPLIESVEATLIQGIKVAREFLHDIGETSGKGAILEKITLVLQQAEGALVEKNFEGFVENCGKLLEMMGITKEALESDIQLIKQAAHVVGFFTAKDQEEQPMTGIVSV